MSPKSTSFDPKDLIFGGVLQVCVGLHSSQNKFPLNIRVAASDVVTVHS